MRRVVLQNDYSLLSGAENRVILREAYKLGKKKLPCVNKGDVGLVHEDNIKRGMWTTAAAEDPVLKRNGVVRSAKVR